MRGTHSSKLPSSEIRRIISTAWATIGAVSNEEYRLITLGKAGRARQRGLRPKTRGAARNTVDHPYGGGGAGCAPRGHRHARTKQGRPTEKVKRHEVQRNTRTNLSSIVANPAN